MGTAGESRLDRLRRFNEARETRQATPPPPAPSMFSLLGKPKRKLNQNEKPRPEPIDLDALRADMLEKAQTQAFEAPTPVFDQRPESVAESLPVVETITATQEQEPAMPEVREAWACQKCGDELPMKPGRRPKYCATCKGKPSSPPAERKKVPRAKAMAQEPGAPTTGGDPLARLVAAAAAFQAAKLELEQAIAGYKP